MNNGRWKIMDKKNEFCFECQMEYPLGTPCDRCNLMDEEEEPEPFFIAIPRTNPMFYRPMVIMGGGKIDVIPRTDTTIVCDVCNAVLGGDLINCATFNDGYSIWGAYCDKCRLEYQGQYPILSLEEAQKRIRDGLIPNES